MLHRQDCPTQAHRKHSSISCHYPPFFPFLLPSVPFIVSLPFSCLSVLAPPPIPHPYRSSAQCTEREASCSPQPEGCAPGRPEASTRQRAPRLFALHRLPQELSCDCESREAQSRRQNIAEVQGQGHWETESKCRACFAPVGAPPHARWTASGVGGRSLLQWRRPFAGLTVLRASQHRPGHMLSLCAGPSQPGVLT